MVPHRVVLARVPHFRWALNQNRLAVADQSGRANSGGGTPASWSSTCGFRTDLTTVLPVGAVFGRTSSTRPIDTTGSSVNGPGRGLVVSIALSPF